LRRREQAKARVAVETDKKLVDLRSTAIALSRDDELRIIDSYLAGFEGALAEGRVRFDNPTDFNAMVRLKEFIQGGADSRQEIHAALSLEDIQTRHRRMMKTMETSSTAERGDLDDCTLAVPISGLQPGGFNPPTIGSAPVAKKVTDEPAGAHRANRRFPLSAAHRRGSEVSSCCATGDAWDGGGKCEFRSRPPTPIVFLPVIPNAAVLGK